MTKAAMTCISGAALRRLVRPLLGVATVAAIGIAIAPAAQAAMTADKGIESSLVAKGPDDKGTEKTKLAVHLIRPAADRAADEATKKKDEGGPK